MLCESCRLRRSKVRTIWPDGSDLRVCSTCDAAIRELERWALNGLGWRKRCVINAQPTNQRAIGEPSAEQ